MKIKKKSNTLCYVHVIGEVKRDKFGRLRHKIYINGQTCKKECVVEAWGLDYAKLKRS